MRQESQAHKNFGVLGVSLQQQRYSPAGAHQLTYINHLKTMIQEFLKEVLSDPEVISGPADYPG
jgi:hypothetical protein